MEKIEKSSEYTTPASGSSDHSASVLNEHSTPGTTPGPNEPIDNDEKLVELLLVGKMPPLGLAEIDRATARPRFANDLDAAIQAIVEGRPDLILVSLALPDDDAFKFVVQLRKMQLDGFERASVVIGIQEDGRALLPLEDDQHGLDGVAAGDDAAAALREWIARIEQQRPAPGIFWIERHIADGFPGYLDSRLKLAVNLADALRREDREVAARSAHMLAGSPGFHGFETWVRCCREIEQWARNGSGPGLHHLERAAELARLLEQPLVR